MILPERFAELSSANLTLSPVSQRLHPLSEHAVQFISDSEEYLALKDLKPYGERTAEAVATGSEVKDILPIAHQGADYTAFKIPEDLLSLERITLGQGFRDISDLIPVYTEAGKIVGKYSRVYSMRNVGVKTIAMLRASGQFVFVPPYHFETEEVDPLQATHDFTLSIQKLLRPILFGKKIARLVQSTRIGFNDGREQA